MKYSDMSIWFEDGIDQPSETSSITETEESKLEKQFKERIYSLRKQMRELSIDTMLVQTEENRRYLSGFTGEDGHFDESAGALLITAEKNILATDSRYELQARKEMPGIEIFCYKQGLAESLPELLERLNTKRMGFEASRLSYHQHKKISETLATKDFIFELVETEHLLELLRAVKDETEINNISSALDLAESVFRKVVSELKPGRTENEIAWNIEKGMREAGAENISFPVIVASGPNSALPHAVPGDRRIHAGEPVLIDWGAKFNGYCSDITRTFVIGRPDDTFKKIFKTVYEAQLRAIDAVKPGVSTKTIDGIARQYIEAQGFKGKFGHSLGHGVGLAIHEYPRLSQFYDKPLQPGMVTTMEPGIYIPDWGGIRLENMIVVREYGAEVLNKLDMVSHVGGESAEWR